MTTKTKIIGPTTANCGNCWYWWNPDTLGKDEGLCRRYPPRPGFESPPIATERSYWCGEHSAHRAADIIRMEGAPVKMIDLGLHGMKHVNPLLTGKDNENE